MLTNHAIALDVFNFIKSNLRQNRLMIAIGKEIPWEIEAEPPTPSPSILSLLNPLAFKLVESIVPIYPDINGSIDIDGTFYSRLENFNLRQIREKEAFQVLFETNIIHDLLPFSSFREAGIVKVTKTSPGLLLTNSEVYNKSHILDYDLEVYQTFSPIFVESETISKIILTRPFS